MSTEHKHASNRGEFGELNPNEVEWREIQPYLAQRGYMLPFRYRVGWKPSWKASEKYPTSVIHEDMNIGINGKVRVVMPATRIYDKSPVVLKRISTSNTEMHLTSKLSSAPLADKPNNRSIPLIDVILVPDDDEEAFLVFPQLHGIQYPYFGTPAELLHCFRRCLQGLNFLHENDIAHRDIDIDNLMMLPGSMFPKGFHTVQQEHYLAGDPIAGRPRLRPAPHLSRTLSDVKYYIIDFGSAKQYPSGPGAPVPTTVGIQGHHDAPEMLRNFPFNPFPTDIWCLGTILLEIVEQYHGWDDKDVRNWLKTLMEKTPENRPNAAEALADVENIIQNMPPSELFKRIYHKSEVGGKNSRSLTELYYTFKAVYLGTNNLKHELFENLDDGSQPQMKDVIKTRDRTAIAKFLTALRYLGSGY